MTIDKSESEKKDCFIELNDLYLRFNSQQPPFQTKLPSLLPSVRSLNLFSQPFFFFLRLMHCFSRRRDQPDANKEKKDRERMKESKEV